MKPYPTSRFLLLDFGHPMTENSVEFVKSSLQNILCLASASFIYSNHFRNFGICLINSKFVIIESTLNLGKNYNSISTKLACLKKPANERVSVQEYKNLLRVSIENTLNEFTKREESIQEMNKSPESRTEITIITKKKAPSFLCEILIEVLKKLPKKYTEGSNSIKKIKIVQLTNEEENNSDFMSNDSVTMEWATCLESVQNLECVFKKWLLKPDTEKRQLGIILSDEIDLIVKCDVDDCIVNTFPSSRQVLGVGDDFLFETPKTAESGTQGNNLKSLCRIPVSDSCSCLKFGITRRAFATKSDLLNWSEARINFYIFKELCRELFYTEQGLLTKFSSRCGLNEITFYYFIISDGNSLLLNNVAPGELYLPQSPRRFRSEQQDDPNARLVVKACLKKLPFRDEYCPAEFSSGLYSFLRTHFKKTAKESSWPGHIDPELKSTVSNIPPKTHGRKINFYRKYKNQDATKQGQTNKRKRMWELEKDTTHPALLSPCTINKYPKTSHVLSQAKINQNLDFL